MKLFGCNSFLEGLPVLLVMTSVVAVSAFQVQVQLSSVVSRQDHGKLTLSASTSALNTIDIDESTPRDIPAMDEWTTACGVQRAEGFQLTVASNDNEPMDVGVVTSENIPANSPVLCVPNNMILSAAQARQELGASTSTVEELFRTVYELDQLPYWYLFAKVLLEYQNGYESAWYPWLNSLPRYYSNGASMTHICCSECLPPFVGQLALKERTRFSQFVRALKYVDFLSEDIKENRQLCKWAFAVVNTRSFDDTIANGSGGGDIKLVPMADMVSTGGCLTVVAFIHSIL